jgi:hypothetical protein
MPLDAVNPVGKFKHQPEALVAFLRFLTGSGSVPCFPSLSESPERRTSPTDALEAIVAVEYVQHVRLAGANAARETRC